jgi:DNA repair ATPase RecN
MPRKKLINSKVKKTKQQVLNQTEAMEKDFKNLPQLLQAQLRKELSVLKIQESKLLVSLKKIQKQYSAAKNKHTLLTTKTKVKPTTTAKKQLATIAKSCNKLDQAIADVMDNIKKIKAQGKTLSVKKAKFAALAKQVIAFDKEWTNKAEKSAVKPTETKVKQRKKRSTKASKIEALSTQEIPMQPESISSDLMEETVE